LLAVDRAGRQMHVAIDARLGDIVNLHPAVPGEEQYGALIAAPGGAPPAYATRPPDERESVPTPPLPIPGGRTANAPGSTAQPSALPPTDTVTPPASRPAAAAPSSPPLPPLPRPRPTLAATDSPAPPSGPPTARPAAPAAAGTPAEPAIE
jgi:hypothetical protein